jgi:hypothetical protein
MPGDSAHGYPLTSASRRRRRLALRHDPATESGSFPVATADDPLVLHPPAPPGGLPPAPGEFDDRSAGDERITRLLAARDPQTWLVVGESFLQPSPEARDWPGWIDRFTTQLRGPLGRRRDAVVDACCVDSTLAELRTRLEMMSAVPRADVVLLVCGPADARSGVAGLTRFEAILNAVVGRFAASGAVVVVGTSPVPCCGPEEPCDIAYDIYAEAVRACAMEREVLLVDHRGHWEQAALPPGKAGSWFDGRADRVGGVGHAELARHLLGVLWRCRPDDFSTHPTQSRADAEIRQNSR